MTELFHLAGSKTNVQNWLQAQKEAGTLTFANAADAADHLFGLTIGGPMLSRLAHCGAARNKADLQRYLEEGLRIFLHAYTPLPLS
ncbi:MAG: TetR/AcrR family transcriptional regulator C-terminal domain-containing protein [Bombella apis]|nr:TetR/AcrR family transcriptional regulator C-terminal domain-containing protein [Bombella apis]